jgi:hypothetical protein
MQLLPPHLGDRHVAALLHLLAAHGLRDGVLGECTSSEAATYLELLKVMAESIARQGSGGSAGAAAGRALRVALVPLLANTFRSMVATTAAIEMSVRQWVADELPAQQGSRQQGAAFQEQVDRRVRQVALSSSKGGMAN